MLDEAATLPDDPDDLQSLAERLIAGVKAQAVLIEKLRHQLAGHRAHRFGASGEAADQLQLALETSKIATAAMTRRRTSRPGIGCIAELHAVEKTIRSSPSQQRVRGRQKHTAPIFDALEDWLAEQLSALSGKTPLAGAMRCALNRLPRLRQYLADGPSKSTTTPPNAPCTAWPSGERTGSSPDHRQAAGPSPSPPRDRDRQAAPR